MPNSSWLKKTVTEFFSGKTGSSWLSAKNTGLAALGGLTLFDSTDSIYALIQNGLKETLEAIPSYKGISGGAIFLVGLLVARWLFGGSPGFFANLIKGGVLVAIYVFGTRYLGYPVSRGIILAILFFSFIRLGTIFKLIFVAACFTVIYSITLAKDSDSPAFPRLRERLARLVNRDESTTVQTTPAQPYPTGTNPTSQPQAAPNPTQSHQPAPPPAPARVNPGLRFSTLEVTVGGRRTLMPIPQSETLRISHQEPAYYSDGSCGITIFVDNSAYFFIILKRSGTALPSGAGMQGAVLSDAVRREFGGDSLEASGNDLLAYLQVFHDGRLSTTIEQQGTTAIFARTPINNGRQNNAAVNAAAYHGLSATTSAPILVRAASVSRPPTGNTGVADETLRDIINSWFGVLASYNTR